MKRNPRDPEKFEVIELLDAIGQKRDFKFNDDSSNKAFLEIIQTSLGSNKTPILIHGRRIEAMFGYVAASLGKCIVIKKEDCGDVFLESTDAKIPDYRIVTRAGEQFLVEVKNCHEDNPSAKIFHKASYLDGLKTYASLVNLELKFAIYWSRWNTWALISPEDFHRDGSAYAITFIDSVKQNQMSILGDFLIGTTPSLAFRLITDPKEQRYINDKGEAIFTVGHVEMSCAGQALIDKEEKDIAYFLIMYGEWPQTEPKAYIENNEVMAIEYIAKPIQKTTGDKYEMIGFLSGMISRQYNDLTAPDGQVERFTPSIESEKLGIKIRDGYKGNQLPLWRFFLQPAK